MAFLVLLCMLYLCCCPSYVRMRQHTSACCTCAGVLLLQPLVAKPRLLSLAYVSIRQLNLTNPAVFAALRNQTNRPDGCRLCRPGVDIRQHTSKYLSIRQHASACVSMRRNQTNRQDGCRHSRPAGGIRQHTLKYLSIRQHTSACVSIRPHR
jgi:hypothetical protein